MAGNANSGRRQEKPFRDALRMEIAEAGSRPQALREIALKLVDEAMKGESWAIKEFADRMDGKVAIQLESGENGFFVTIAREAQDL